MPWSEWITPPACGSRLAMAMLSAFVTGAAFWLERIEQSTTRRENVSRTTVQYTFPS